MPGRRFVFQEKDALVLLLRQTSNVIAKIRDRDILSLGVSADVLAVLFAIARLGDEARPARLARDLLLESHSVSEQLARMQKEGLIRKIKDKSRVRIVLTEKGYNTYTTQPRRITTRKMVTVISADERRLLWDLLARLRDSALDSLNVPSTDVFPPSDPRRLRGRVANARRVAQAGHVPFEKPPRVPKADSRRHHTGKA